MSGKNSLIALRLSDNEIKAIDAIASSKGLTRSEEIRRRLFSNKLSSDTPLHVFSLDSPFGVLDVACSSGSVVSSRLPGEKVGRFLNYCSKWILANKGFLTSEKGPYEDEIKKSFSEYWNKNFVPLSQIKVELLVSKVEQGILEHVRSISPGETTTYKEIAICLGRGAAASRAVGAANAKNPIPIIIPCHRVVASDGSLKNYLGGVRMKAALLEHEA